MFKYKSPLSRLLEGAGKAKDETAETEDVVEVQPEQPEPIADFNALRAALAGGNMTSESYEETDDLMPQEQMPEFEGNAEAELDEPAEDSSDTGASDTEEDQIVTLHLTPADAVDTEQDVLAAVTDEVTVEAEEMVEPAVAPEPISEPETAEEPETIAQPQPVAEPEIVAEPEAITAPEPVAEEPAPQLMAEEPAPQPVAVVEPASDAEPEASAPAQAEDRRGRVKTTFLGFERADTHVQDLIETSEPVAKTEAAQQSFPVGWLVVTNGPGRGSSITLTEGLMQIGRNDDQAIQLDFGDTGISRSNHAVIAYDPEDRKCYLGHGGKANLVRLNGKPVLSTVPLSSGDLIRISETSIRFMAFCDEGFDWRDAD